MLGHYKTALVTGASSEIGRAIALGLAAKGLRVIAVARRAERLAELVETPGIEALPLDLRDPAAIHDGIGGLEADVLVNNAGTGRGFEGLAAASPEDIETTLKTNLGAVLHLLRATLPGMIARRRGHVVNIGSTSGLYPTVSGLYASTKGGIHMLASGLRLELRGSGLRVTEICPGRVDSEFYEAAFDDQGVAARTKASGIEDLRPEDVAEAVVYALSQPWRVNVSTIELVPNEQAYGGMHFTPAAREER